MSSPSDQTTTPKSEPSDTRRRVSCVLFVLLVTCFCFIETVDNAYTLSQSAPRVKDKLPQNITPSSPATATVTIDANNMLTVPFYIYKELDMLDEVTVGNISLHESVAHNPLWPSGPKHADDYFFLQAARRHPLRTHDPSQAKLFVVPVPTNHLVFTIVYKMKERQVCWKDICGRDLLLHVDRVLGDTPWFQEKSGEDHIVPWGVWGWDHPAVKGRQLTNIYQCNILGFGEANNIQNPDRRYFKKIYVGHACDLSPHKTHDMAMIASLRPGDRRFKSRRDICKWMGPDHKNSSSNMLQQKNHSMSVCGHGQQCPALAESRLGFHVRGDSFGANRLLDTLLSGTVPIFTMQQQYNVNPEWFDWDKISYFADVQNKTSFLESMEQILADKEGYAKRLENVLLNRRLFDWRSGGPFDTYMYMLQVHLWPETAVRSNRYTALK